MSIESKYKMFRPPPGRYRYGDLEVERFPSPTGRFNDLWPEGSVLRTVGFDPETGGALSLLYLPPGFLRDEEVAYYEQNNEHRFEYHTGHEEVIVLEGRYIFGSDHHLEPISYLNHPPYWLHLAYQTSDIGALLFIRESQPADFGFERLPEGWDGEGSVAEGKPRVVNQEGFWRAPLPLADSLQTAEMGWSVITAGLRTLPILRGSEEGWDVSALSFDKGWSGPLDLVGEHAKENELFILNGEMALSDDLAPFGRFDFLALSAMEQPVLHARSRTTALFWHKI